ncbi:hypothetical protein HPB50_020172 [Hyalomma asiaticum]|uniref:Uncharacterized protein n=1 Tax=Hyalomma asiaticum TaxID=266040 RepID=A0ACB7TLB3_HYAAI|nr:hypothetical protein HPB50_020172 [Hyalomma asiaticum]
MASTERMQKSSGVVRASVMRTITVLTDEMQASILDVTQVESHINYLIQKNVELVNLDKQITNTTDDYTYKEELEVVRVRQQSTLCHILSEVLSLRACGKSDGDY